ncbi:hypothetical protein I7I48_01413 [Histoplasma ohiense]|nr:hypothetical protein I7I48_01413 [Histoplasma ohiense (nom. inval.)]
MRTSMIVLCTLHTAACSLRIILWVTSEPYLLECHHIPTPRAVGLLSWTGVECQVSYIYTEYVLCT